MIKIKLLTKKDIPAAVGIVRKNYTKKWWDVADREIKNMFSNASIKPVYYVAEEKGKIIGFAGYMQSWMDYYIYQICWVNVTPERQKQGIGKKLVAKAIQDIKKKKHACLILLTATIDNALYYKEHFGFKTIQSFSKNDEHLMSLDIQKKV